MIIFNSLTRKKEKFEPLKPPNVGIYTCGPTVYDYASIGNFRTYTISDVLVRTLKFTGYKVKYIMNLTDVGHLTGDNLGDADTGEDRMEKAAKRERKTAWDIAKFYTGAFLSDYDKLNLTKPELFVKATDHIKEQIELVKRLKRNGLTYKTSDGVYFDTVKYEETSGKKYGELSNLDVIKEGARVEPNKEKKNPRDFALWKFSPSASRRDMEWESPWGMGFPGWHIECSAMSMKYLGESFDIHVGGEDLKSTHHPNEIAQAEGATGKPFVKYWVHGAFLLVDGGRMGKSLGNAYRLEDIEKRGIDPLALRYFYFTGHYRSQLNFTWEALNASAAALNNLRDMVRVLKQNTTRTVLSPEKRVKTASFMREFSDALMDDLNMPQALAVVWKSVKSNIPSEDKYDLLMNFDEVLGLNLASVDTQEIRIPGAVRSLAISREKFRKEGKFKEADEARQKIAQLGFILEDTPNGPRLKKS
jgi:cysteinyl-tRNA synthetase